MTGVSWRQRQMKMSFFQVLCRNAELWRDKTAIVDGPVALTHGELLRRVLVLAGALQREGQPRRVLILLPNGNEIILSHYAALAAGAVALLARPEVGQETLTEVGDTFQPDAVVTTGALAGQHSVGLGTISSIRELVLLPNEESASALETLKHCAVRELLWSRAEAAGEFQDSALIDSASLVLCTSGTTGAPKFVILSQRSMMAAALSINEFMQVGEWAREVTPLPLFRSFGLGRARCLSLVGGTLIVSPPRGDRALALVQRYGANGLSSVPAFFRMLLQTFGPRLGKYFGGLRYIEIGSAPMRRADKLLLLEVAPMARICMHYGLTEASRSAFIEFRSEREKLDSVGKSAPGVEIKVVAEDGSVCDRGEVGEIAVRGQHVCGGYWGDSALTAERLRDGWLYTRDRGRFDEQGYLHLAGRIDDVINVGGVKVAPEKIEDVARRIPGVADCAAVAMVDPNGVYGEVPLLYVVPDGSSELSIATVKSCCAQHLLAEEAPHDVMFIESIPRTDTGKIQRAQLRAQTGEPAVRNNPVRGSA
jgi:long-chain acyl-CoA synthetase